VPNSERDKDTHGKNQPPRRNNRLPKNEKTECNGTECDGEPDVADDTMHALVTGVGCCSVVEPELVLGGGIHNVRLATAVDEDPVRIPITDVFDLHSVPPRDVKPIVQEYLAEAYRMGFRALRIIHGRGIGVQREIVRSVLARTPFVESFGDAPGEAGGWGATVINLAPK